MFSFFIRKQCINSESRFDFLKDLVATVPDVQGEEDLAETPNPRSSSVSNSAFVYPTMPVPGTSSRNSGPLPSSALGAPDEAVEEEEEDDDDDDEQPQQYEHQKIAGTTMVDE